LFEIPYKALPADMVESVTVDLEGMEIGDSVSLADLDIAKNDAIELLIEADSPVVNIIEQRAAEASDEDEEGDLGEEAATEAEEEA
jgi:large subunit ribosomal protein L25